MVAGNMPWKDKEFFIETDMSIDYAIITALREELTAVLHYFCPCEETHGRDSIRTYHRTTLRCSDGSSKTLVALCTLGMGRVESALATADLIKDWNPRTIF